MILEDFEQFIKESWDYVSRYVVSDKFWIDNSEFIREITFELYQKHRKSGIVYDGQIERARFSPKEAGRLLESFFSTLNKYKIRY